MLRLFNIITGGKVIILSNTFFTGSTISLKFFSRLNLLLSFFLITGFTNSVFSQLVTNGSVSGSPCANSGINNGYAAGWTVCNFSPDLCCVAMPSYVSTSAVAPAVSPDGGTWLGIAALGECAQTTITGLTVGTTYTLYFCGACFGTGALYNTAPGVTQITVGASVVSFSIPRVASTWFKYSMTFVANAASMVLRCDQLSGSNSYSDLDGFSLSPTSPCGPTVLPIELMSFSADYNNGSKNVDLKWIVAMEKEVDHYLIEKSDDAVNFKEMEKIYNLTGNTNSMKNYSAVDLKPVSGKINYYRLKEVDRTGEYYYSPTRTVFFMDKDAELNLIPNPANETVQLKFASATEGSWTITVFNNHGDAIASSSHYASAGINSPEIDLKNYEKGIYFVLVTNNSTTYKRKLIKQ